MTNRVRRGGESSHAVLREVRLTIADPQDGAALDRLPTQHGPPTVDSGPERRDLASRAALVERFRAEFREMPGLWVTRSEARRLFGAPEDICQRVLDGLVGEGTLVRTSGGIYRTPPNFGSRR